MNSSRIGFHFLMDFYDKKARIPLSMFDVRFGIQSQSNYFPHFFSILLFVIFYLPSSRRNRILRSLCVGTEIYLYVGINTEGPRISRRG